MSVLSRKRASDKRSGDIDLLASASVQMVDPAGIQRAAGQATCLTSNASGPR